MLTTLLLTTFSCKTDKADEVIPFVPDTTDTTTVIITFNNDVAPILATNCAIPTCHVDGGFAPFDATDKSAVEGFSDKIIPALRRTGPIGMPYDPATFKPAAPLADSLIDVIETWIQTGKQ